MKQCVCNILNIKQEGVFAMPTDHLTPAGAGLTGSAPQSISRHCVLTGRERKEFLQETEFCDFNHPAIQKLSREICGKLDCDRDKVVALYYWVRDNVLYRIGLWNRKASETLWEMEGTCSNKANLLIALLRANNIPAAYGIYKVSGQLYFGDANFMGKFVSKVSYHVYTLVYLDRWIEIDASDDCHLSRSVQHIIPQATELHFDGFNDAKLKIESDHIISNEGPVANIDHVFRKKLRHRGLGILLSVGNLWLKYFRETKKRFQTHEELKANCLAFLKMHHPLYYRPVVILLTLKDYELKIRGLYKNESPSGNH